MVISFGSYRAMERITLSFIIPQTQKMDYDEASYDDTVCQLWYGVWSSEPFLGEFTLSGETDSGNCAVKIKIEKVGDPVPLDSP